MFLDVGLKILLEFRLRVFMVVFFKLFLNKLLLFYDNFNGFLISLVLPVQKAETVIPRLAVAILARGELGLSRLKWDCWLSF